MDVYKFDKNLLERTNEFLSVLDVKHLTIPASRVKNEWAYYIEIQIEPTGWQALWKIPRAICDDLNIKYPTFAFGMVENVLFTELKAIFKIIAVQDDNVHLPVHQEVLLVDLWVTKDQENVELNIEKTAEILDSLKFFYNNIWMPWDYDDDDDNSDWSHKYLGSRIRFYYDLKKNEIKKSTTKHIRSLLIEAHYLQSRREYLEFGLSDDETDVVERARVTDLMRIHLKLSMIRNKLEILENPVMREIYEEFKYNENEKKNDGEKVDIFIVAQPATLDEHIELLNNTKAFIESNKIAKMCPKLQDALNICNRNDVILLSPGKHFINFLEYLNGNNTMIGVNSAEENKTAKITSNNDESILLVFDGDYTLKNITLDCRNMDSGVYIKNCNITFEDCKIIGNENPTNTQGIIVFGNANLILKNCLIEKFYTGIVLNDSSTLNLTDSRIQLCRTGIELNCKSSLDLYSSEIVNCDDFAITCESSLLKPKNVQFKRKIYENLKINDFLNPPWTGNCLFKNNKKGNILLTNNRDLKVHTEILKSNNSNCLDDFVNGSMDDENISDNVATFEMIRND